MIKRSRSFELEQGYDDLLAAMQEPPSKRYPLNIVKISPDENPVTFSITQYAAGIRGMVMAKATGVVYPESTSTTQVEIEIDYFSWPLFVAIGVQFIILAGGYLWLHSTTFPSQILNIFVIISGAFIVWNRMVYIRPFRRRMKSLFSSAWRG